MKKLRKKLTKQLRTIEELKSENENFRLRLEEDQAKHRQAMEVAIQKAKIEVLEQSLASTKKSKFQSCSMM